MKKFLLFGLFFAACSVAQANDSARHDKVFSTVLHEPFTEAFDNVEMMIQDAGYKVLRVQRVDFGLHDAGYETEPYRIIFYGRNDIENAIKEQPSLAVYLPLQITVYGKGEDTHVVAMNPLNFTNGSPVGVVIMATQWADDVEHLFVNINKMR